MCRFLSSRFIHSGQSVKLLIYCRRRILVSLLRVYSRVLGGSAPYQSNACIHMTSPQYGLEIHSRQPVRVETRAHNQTVHVSAISLLLFVQHSSSLAAFCKFSIYHEVNLLISSQFQVWTVSRPDRISMLQNIPISTQFDNGCRPCTDYRHHGSTWRPVSVPFIYGSPP